MRYFTILVGDDQLSDNSGLKKDLSAPNRQIVFARNAADTVTKACQMLPDLILVNPQMWSTDVSLATRTVRSATASLRAVPILSYSTYHQDVAGLHAAGFDGQVLHPADAATLLATTALWNPDGILVGVNRLAKVFGIAEMSDLVDQFGEQLRDAVTELDLATNRETAHRVAGIAGTLGFDRVGQSWLRLSEGDDTREEARRTARVAIHQTILWQRDL